MRINFNKIQKAIGTRLGFVLTLLTLYWLKTLLAYAIDFNLDIQLGKLQGNYLAFIDFFNPLPLGLLLLALALYARSTKIFYSLSIAIYSLLFIWLYSNVFYYREFSDFITANTMKVVSKVSVGTAELELLRPWDLIYFMDFPLLAYLLYKKFIHLDRSPSNSAPVLLSLLSQPCSFLLIFSWQRLNVPISYREDFLIIMLSVPLVCQPF